MRYSYSLGFYFQLDSSLQEPTTNSYWRCSNEDCEHHKEKNHFKSGNFCQTCGKPPESFDEPGNPGFPCPYEFCEEHLGDPEVVCRMMGDNAPENVWRYNYHSSTEKDMLGSNDLDEGDLCAIDMTQFDFPTRIAKFKQEERVNKFLTAFKKVYGEDKITVKFGLLVQFS